MKKQDLLEDSNYDPDRLLNHLIEVLNLKNDAALSRLLEVAPPIISKVRHRVLPLGPALLIRMHEVSNLNIRDMKDLMGDRRQKQRISPSSFKPVEENLASDAGLTQLGVDESEAVKQAQKPDGNSPV